MTTDASVWMWDDPATGFHDSSCSCPRHCLNCRMALVGRQRKYCSEGCARQWRREVEFDRLMSGAGS